MKKGEQNSSKQEQGTVANRKVKKMEKRRSGTQSSQAGLKTTKVMSTFKVTMSQDSNELPNNLQ